MKGLTEFGRGGAYVSYVLSKYLPQKLSINIQSTTNVPLYLKVNDCYSWDKNTIVDSVLAIDKPMTLPYVT